MPTCFFSVRRWGDPARPGRPLPPRLAALVVVRHVQGVPFLPPRQRAGAGGVIPARPGRPLPLAAAGAGGWSGTSRAYPFPGGAVLV